MLYCKTIQSGLAVTTFLIRSSPNCSIIKLWNCFCFLYCVFFLEIFLQFYKNRKLVIFRKNKTLFHTIRGSETHFKLFFLSNLRLLRLNPRLGAEMLKKLLEFRAYLSRKIQKIKTLIHGYIQ